MSRVMGTEDLLQGSTVYAFHVPDINAIKVGFGVSGIVRMRSYSRQYGLSASMESLREWKLPSTSLASAVEVACHRALLEADFLRVEHVVDEREARELFDLGPHSYEDAVLLVAEAIDESVNSMYAALAKLKPLSQEKGRQQKEQARERRYELREERAASKAQEESDRVARAIPDIQRRWGGEVEPFIKACDAARSVWKRFSYSQGFIDAFINGRRSAAFRMKRWGEWPTVKKLIPEIFHSARKAKSFYLELKSRHGKYVDQAARQLGLSLHSPGGYSLPMVGNYSKEYGMAFLEIRLVVQQATGFGGEDAEELIKMDSDLVALVTYAEKIRAPELR